MPQLIDSLIRHPDDVEVHDRVIVRPLDHLDDTGQERLDGVTSDDQRSRSDPVRLRCLAEERPHVAGLVHLVHVSP